jgi:hypothetical protein
VSSEQISEDLVAACIRQQAHVSDVSDVSFGSEVVSSATSYTPDPYAVSKAEADSYYAGLPTEPTLIYRTGEDKWTPPIGPKAQQRRKELRPVFGHGINKVWNDDLGWKVVDVMDAHKVCYYLSYHRVHPIDRVHAM